VKSCRPNIILVLIDVTPALREDQVEMCSFSKLD